MELQMETMSYYIGCDISSKTFTSTVLDHDGNLILKSSEFENNSNGFSKFNSELIKTSIIPKGTVILIEATGVYGDNLCYYFVALGFNISVEAPHKIKNSIKESPRKNDLLDSARIAEYAYRFIDKLERWNPPSEILSQIKSLLSLREHLVEQMTSNKNALGTAKRKYYRNRTVEDLYQESIKLSKDQIKKIDQQIRDHIDKDDSFRHKTKLLLTVPGVGLLLASNLMVLTDGFTKAVTYKQMSAYAGICPFEKQSGTSIYRKPISKRVGPGKLRKLLYLASLSVRTHNQYFREYFCRKTAQGKNKRLVLNNIANKIIKLAFAVINNNKPFINNYISLNPNSLT